jgi:hypothetical protein
MKRFLNAFRYLLVTAILIFLAVLFLYNRDSQAKSNKSSNMEAQTSDNTFLLTVFLRHDESKTLDEIQQKLKETGFYSKFPPKGIEIESWKVLMGIGQVVTLKVPVSRLREVNLALEKSAWGSFRTEFYPTYDYLPVYKAMKDSLNK